MKFEFRTITLTVAELAELRRLRLPGATRVMDYLEAQGVWPDKGGIFEIPTDMIKPTEMGFFRAAVARARKAVTAGGDDPVWADLRKRIHSVRKNALRKGMTFELSIEDLFKLYNKSGGRCQVSGAPFSLDKYGTSRSPFAPSIDRINCGKGYVISNVRLTCQIANLEMNVWGAEVLGDFIRKASCDEYLG